MASFVSSNLKRSLRKLNKDLDVIMDAGSPKKIKASMGVLADVDTEEFEAALDLIDRFPDAAAKAFYFSMKIVCNDLMAELDRAMEASVWSWSDGSTRDIIDTGKLQESGRCVYDPNTNQIIVAYNTDYAEIVHYGGVIQSPLNPDVDIVFPARPWVESVILGNGPVPAFNFQKTFNSIFFDALERNLGLKL